MNLSVNFYAIRLLYPLNDSNSLNYAWILILRFGITSYDEIFYRGIQIIIDFFANDAAPQLD